MSKVKPTARPGKLTKSEIIVKAFDSTEYESVTQIARVTMCARSTVYDILDRYRPGWRRGWPPIGSRKARWLGAQGMLDRMARVNQARGILQGFEESRGGDHRMSNEFYLSGIGYCRLYSNRSEHITFLEDLIEGKPPAPSIVKAITPRIRRRRLCRRA